MPRRPALAGFDGMVRSFGKQWLRKVSKISYLVQQVAPNPQSTALLPIFSIFYIFNAWIAL